MKTGTRIRLAIAIALFASALGGCALQRFGAPPPLPASLVPVDEAQAQSMISAYRRAHGLSGLQLDATLVKAAQAQALAMAEANDLSHTVNGDLESRLARVGEPPRAADENISGGYGGISAALAGWRNSPPHNRNLLDPNMRRMGIGSGYAAGSRYHQYWSLILAD